MRLKKATIYLKTSIIFFLWFHFIEIGLFPFFEIASTIMIKLKVWCRFYWKFEKKKTTKLLCKKITQNMNRHCNKIIQSMPPFDIFLFVIYFWEKRPRQEDMRPSDCIAWSTFYYFFRRLSKRNVVEGCSLHLGHV